MCIRDRYSVERTKLFGVDHELSEFYQLNPSELELLDDKTIVFGTDDYIEMMFHTEVYAAYRKVPNQAKINTLEQQGFSVYLMKNGRLEAVQH